MNVDDAVDPLPESSLTVKPGTKLTYTLPNKADPNLPFRYDFVVKKMVGAAPPQNPGIAVCLANNQSLLGPNDLGVLKIVFPNKLQGSTAKQLSLREQEVAQALTDQGRTFHPFVSKNYGRLLFSNTSLPQGEEPIYAMHNKWYPNGDYVAGLLQNELIGRRQFVPEEEFKTYMKSALQGLAYIHSRQVSHRDIKPDNILVDGCFSILTDFGASKITKSSANITFVGTALYQAPELIPKNGVMAPFTNACDIWSLGVTFYRMLFGGHPSDLDENFSQHSRMTFPSSPTINPELRNILVSMSDHDPSRRPPASEILTRNYFQAIQYPAEVAPYIPV